MESKFLEVAPSYGVRIRFYAGADEIDVLLCFHCNLLAVYRNGVLTGGEGFDFIRPVLVRTVKSLFPRAPGHALHCWHAWVAKARERLQEAALDGSSVGGDRASGGQPTPRVFAVGAVPLRH